MTTQPATAKPAEKKPVTPGQIFLVAMILLGICGMILYALGHKSVINGSRSAVGQPMNATVVSSFLGLIPLGQNDFPGLKKASLGATRGGRNSSVSYSTWVDCDRGYLALIPISGGSEESHRALTQEINAALSDPALLTFSAVYGPHPYFQVALVLIATFWVLSALAMSPTVRRMFRSES